jgi:EAL and modified HD-GYP domain-containing signal transduction protein
MTASTATSAKPTSCLARQPILTKDEKVLGYELFFRESYDDVHFSSDFETATSNTIDSLNVMGLDVVCDGRLGFINCTREMLLKEYFLLLPPDKVVIEVQENVTADEEVVGACQRLKRAGYQIALDNFTVDDPRAPLGEFAEFLKVDIRRQDTGQISDIIRRYRNNNRHIVAQKVETRLQFITSMKDGFTYFQGYFFQIPERMRARQIPGSRAGHLRLLQAISAPVVDLAKVEELIKHDASLCYRLLRYLNSPLLGVSCPVHSIRHAMNLLGEHELVRWIRMATALAVGHEKCSDLILSSLVRARFGELIAPKVDHGKSDLFLIGLFSMMDAILDVPMGVVVEGLSFDPETRGELLGLKTERETLLSPIYQLMIGLEQGDWGAVAAFARKLNLALTFVNRTYTEAMKWARQMTAADTIA